MSRLALALVVLLAVVPVSAAQARRRVRPAAAHRPRGAARRRPTPTARPSGAALGTAPINGVTPPFPGQPVQGFSAVLDAGGGEYWAMPDNGFGAKANSGDFLLRMYRIDAALRDRGRRQRHDRASASTSRCAIPDNKIPFDIVRGDLPGRLADRRRLRHRVRAPRPQRRAVVRRRVRPVPPAHERDRPRARGADPGARRQVARQPDARRRRGRRTSARARASRGWRSRHDGDELLVSLEGALTTDPDPRRRLIFTYDLAAHRFVSPTRAVQLRAAGQLDRRPHRARRLPPDHHRARQPPGPGRGRQAPGPPRPVRAEPRAASCRARRSSTCSTSPTRTASRCPRAPATSASARSSSSPSRRSRTCCRSATTACSCSTTTTSPSARAATRAGPTTTRRSSSTSRACTTARRRRAGRPSTSRSSVSTTSTATSSRPPARSCCPSGARVDAGGVEYLATHVDAPARAEPAQHDRRRRRRPHRREPADLRAVPRRADDRGDEPPRPRAQLGRQPRVRRGLRRAPADAVRRLPPGRRLPGRRRLRRRGLRVPRGERRAHVDRHDALPAVRDQGLRRRQGRLHRHDAAGHAGDRHAVGRRGPRVPRRGRHGQRARARAQAPRRRDDRRAAARGRRADGPLRRSAPASRARSSTSSTARATRSTRSSPATPTRPTTASSTGAS